MGAEVRAGFGSRTNIDNIVGGIREALKVERDA